MSEMLTKNTTLKELYLSGEKGTKKKRKGKEKEKQLQEMMLELKE